MTLTKEVITEKIKNLFRGDKVIWMVAVLLALISMLVVYTSIAKLAYSEYDGNNAYVLVNHLLMLLLGLTAMVVAANINYKRYSRLLLMLFWIAIPLLLYTQIAEITRNEARRFIHIWGYSFQPSDLAKLAMVGFMARVLTLHRDTLDNTKNIVVEVVVPMLVIVGLIFKSNLSTAMMLFATCIVMMFLGKIKMKYILGIVGTIALAGCLAILILLNTKNDDADSVNRSRTWVGRIERFMGKQDSDDKTKMNGKDFQQNHAKIAIASGGFFGKMPGKSTQRSILPQSHSDFIYSIIIEEYGLLGGVCVLLLYLILFYRATLIMIRAPQTFGAMLAMGLAFSLVLQAMVHIGVSVGLLPVTGQPMPFVSRGGTSLLFTGISLGIIISVTREIYKNDGKGTEIDVTESSEADS